MSAADVSGQETKETQSVKSQPLQRGMTFWLTCDLNHHLSRLEDLFINRLHGNLGQKFHLFPKAVQNTISGH